MSRFLWSNEWGIASIRARVLSRLETYADVAAKRDIYPALTRELHMVRVKFAALWPEAQPLSLYPAFR
jgi:autonomous glycyl radical cofactor GrcA